MVRSSRRPARLSRRVRSTIARVTYAPWVPFAVRVRVYYWAKRRSWSTRAPTTFNEKIQWKMLKDRRPLLTRFADRVAAREYVAQTVGPEVLTECHAVVGDPLELDRARLPREFAVKASHGSGGVWIVADRAPTCGPSVPGEGWSHTVTTPDALDWNLLVARCREWLATRYGAFEWAYLDVPPRIIVEELLTDHDGNVPPPDYKFFVFNGRGRFLQVVTGRFTMTRATFFRPDWTRLEVAEFYPTSEREIPRPATLDRMIEVAERLGRETDFVRVDLYDAGGRVAFGELTSYPAAGALQFAPKSFDAIAGGWWTPPRKYR